MPTPDFIVGVIGNVITILVCASPLRTFWEVVKKKSIESYDGLPYISTLLCRTLWVFYGILDPNGLLIITVNSVGVAIHVIYVILFLIYTPKDKKANLVILVVVLNIVLPTIVIVLALVAFHGGLRCTFIGVLCATVTVGMYVAPLLIMRLVVKTKSVEYMSFSLLFLLFLNAGTWFTFAIGRKDYFLIVPNVVGLVLSLIQLIMYVIYTSNSNSAKNMKNVNDCSKNIRLKEAQDLNEALLINKSLKKGSTFSISSMSRQHSTIKIKKTLSWKSYFLNYGPPNESDIEKGEIMVRP